MTASLDELPDRHRWTLHDHRVTQLVVELGGVRLVTWTLHASLDVRLGAAFTLRQADGVERARSKIEYSVWSTETGCTAWAARRVAGPASLMPK